jgi:hypothetical protein
MSTGASILVRLSAVFGIVAPAIAQTAIGPSILSRGGLQQNPGGSSNLIRLRPFASLQATYQDGLTPAVLEDGTTIPEVSTASGTATFGLFGYHDWRRSLLGIGYQGRYRYIGSRRARSLDGFDHFLSLGFSHQPTKRLTFSLTEVGGISPRAIAGIPILPGLGTSSGLGLGQHTTDPNFNEVPGEDLVDTRTIFASSGGDLTYQKSARLSFHAGATGFLVRRKASGLAGATGFTTRGDIAYALSRRSTVGIDYGYLSYGYNRTFGDANAHILALNYTRMLGRRWNTVIRAGAYRLEFLTTQRVTLDPVIAAIIGQRTGREVLYGVTYGSIINANLNGNFRRSGVNFGYNRRVLPGNGIYLTSVADRAGVSYSYQGFRAWSFGGSATYSQYSARTQQLPHYRQYGLNASVGRRLFEWVHFRTNVGVRRSEVAHTFRRDSWFVSAGLGFTPDDIPISFW